jgi:hypothetical protein
VVVDVAVAVYEDDVSAQGFGAVIRDVKVMGSTSRDLGRARMGFEFSMRRGTVWFQTHLTKLIEGKGVGEALASLVPATRSESGRMMLASFIMTLEGDGRVSCLEVSTPETCLYSWKSLLTDLTCPKVFIDLAEESCLSSAPAEHSLSGPLPRSDGMACTANVIELPHWPGHRSMWTFLSARSPSEFRFQS